MRQSDLDGKGYPEGRLGPDFRLHLPVLANVVTAGRTAPFQVVSMATIGVHLFAGSGGYIYRRTDSAGGGYGHIRAGVLTVDGDISADGVGASNYGGVGGGLAYRSRAVFRNIVYGFR